jgi:glycosyltransferase involved in cell wall biosynthesis
MKERVTVLHTESSLGWGGQEQRTLRECLGILKLGMRPAVLCPPEAEVGRRAAAAGIEVFPCRMRKSYDLAAIRTILRVLREQAVDVVNTHSGRDSFLAGVAARLSRRRPAVVRTRHLAMPITSRISYSYLPHRVVTVSGYVKEYLVREGVPGERIVVVPTGIDAGRFADGAAPANLREELGLPKDALLVGVVAVLRMKKGHRSLLEAAPFVLAAFPRTVFVIAGAGPQEKNLGNAIGSMGLSGSVRMLGHREDVSNVLLSLDLFVLPTVEEALGTAFVEAMAAGRAVVGCRVGGVPEVVEEGKTGLLVPPGDPAALADAIRSLLADGELRRRMGAAGRQVVLARYSEEEMCKRMWGMYRSLLAERGRG